MLAIILGGGFRKKIPLDPCPVLKNEGDILVSIFYGKTKVFLIKIVISPDLLVYNKFEKLIKFSLRTHKCERF